MAEKIEGMINLPGMKAEAVKVEEGVGLDRILASDESVPFTYPEGFNAAANSLRFLPNMETRVQTLTAIMLGVLF
jgi:hypothetical protein